MSPEPSFRLYVLEVGTYNPFRADKLAGGCRASVRRPAARRWTGASRKTRAAPFRSCEQITAGMVPVPHLRRSKGLAVLDPGLTAGPTHYRLFEAGLEMIVCLVLGIG